MEEEHCNFCNAVQFLENSVVFHILTSLFKSLMIPVTRQLHSIIKTSALELCLPSNGICTIAVLEQLQCCDLACCACFELVIYVDVPNVVHLMKLAVLYKAAGAEITRLMSTL